MDEQKVDVSILTPVYDEPLPLIQRNIMSVMLQETTYKFEQLVVVDNPNIPVEVLNYLYNQTDTHYFIHKENKGLSAARNTALEQAKGEFIMLLDADDSFVSGRIQKQIDFMKANPYIAHSFGGYQEIHGNKPEPEPYPVIPGEFNPDLLTNFHNQCFCGSNCFTKEVYDTIGGFDENMKTGAEDLEYFIRLHKFGFKSKCLPEVLYYLGITNNNMTAKLIKNGGFEKAYEYIRQKYPNLTFPT
jgi:glycosyltransferase involved in cell wall biosynthesis